MVITVASDGLRSSFSSVALAREQEESDGEMCGEVQRGMRCRENPIRELSRQLTDRCLSPGDLLDQKGGERLKTMIEIRLRVRTKAACVN